MGTHDALLHRGVRLPKIGMERAYKKTDASEVLYLAFDHRFRLAYAAEYRVSKRFADAVSLLDRMGYASSLIACDPLVGAGSLEVKGARRLPAVQVARSTRHDEVSDGAGGAVIATDRSTDLAFPLAACHLMRRAYRLGEWLTWLGMVILLLASMTAVYLGGTWLLGSATLMLWQMLCAVVTAVLTLVVINRRTMGLVAHADKQKENHSKTAPPTDKR